VEAGNECGLKHHMPQQASSAADGAFAAQSTAVMRYGREPGECGGLFSGNAPQFGHLGDQHRAGDRADAGNGAQDLGDRGYDANSLRATLARAGTEAVIPSTRSRKRPIPHDVQAYRARNMIERAFCSLKDFRRIATRYDKLALDLQQRPPQHGDRWDHTCYETETSRVILQADPMKNGGITEQIVWPKSWDRVTCG